MGSVWLLVLLQVLSSKAFGPDGFETDAQNLLAVRHSHTQKVDHAQKDDDVSCHCTHPQAGTVGQNGMTCSDGSTPTCTSYMFCVATGSFKWSEVNEVACKYLFRTAPFLMTHDAATGYAGGSVQSNYVQTQTVNLINQLSCGVRAFDLRLQVWYEDWRQIHFWHGPWSSSDQTVQSELPKIVQWVQDHPEELVVIVLGHCQSCRYKGDSHCTSYSCTYDQFVTVFEGFGAKVQNDCATLNTWTLDEARDFAQMDSGGMLLVVPGEQSGGTDGECIAPNWDEDAKSIAEVEAYLEAQSAQWANYTTPFQTQAFRQQGAGHVHMDPDLNAYLADELTTYPSGLFQGVNFLEINNVCAKGGSMALRLGAKITEADFGTCEDACMDEPF